jgi:hypothetical protein
VSGVNVDSYIKPAVYTGLLARANSLPIMRFLLRPGMGFGDTLKWWAEGSRVSAHNGADLLWYESSGGTGGALDAGAAVPVIAPGRVAAVIPDYIAKSIAVEHAVVEGRRLMSLYGHIELSEAIQTGQSLQEGYPIGRVAASAKSAVPAHLHISLALVPEGMPEDIIELTWEALEQRAVFIDPLPYL